MPAPRLARHIFTGKSLAVAPAHFPVVTRFLATDLIRSTMASRALLGRHGACERLAHRAKGFDQCYEACAQLITRQIFVLNQPVKLCDQCLQRRCLPRHGANGTVACTADNIVHQMIEEIDRSVGQNLQPVLKKTGQFDRSLRLRDPFQVGRLAQTYTPGEALHFGIRASPAINDQRQCPAKMRSWPPAFPAPKCSCGPVRTATTQIASTPVQDRWPDPRSIGPKSTFADH